MDNHITTQSDLSQDVDIRPDNLENFIGQQKIIHNLNVYSRAAKIRKESLDHIIFFGPPGLGKTTLARIIANLQGSGFYSIAAPNLQRPGDIAKIVTTLSENDVLFIDEIHRLPANVEEILYSVMEDSKIEITLSEGMASAPVQIDLPPFTLVGATTKIGAISGPLRDRFGIQFPLEYYSEDEIQSIILRSAKIWGISVDQSALKEIARRSRGTPRIANHLLRRISDFVIADANNQSIQLTLKNVIESCKKIGIDENGISDREIKMLLSIAKDHQGGPVGLKPLSALLAEDIVNIEESIEPYLVRKGLIIRTSRGRILSRKGYQYLGLPVIKNNLFADSNKEEI